MRRSALQRLRAHSARQTPRWPAATKIAGALGQQHPKELTNQRNHSPSPRSPRLKEALIPSRRCRPPAFRPTEIQAGIPCLRPPGYGGHRNPCQNTARDRYQVKPNSLFIRVSSLWSGAQRLRPSKCPTFRGDKSTPSRQRALIATMYLPVGAMPSPNGAHPHWGQKRCLIWCLLNV